MKRVCVFCGASTGHDPAYAQAAAALGRAIAARGLGLVYGGGSVGLMGVVAQAAQESGAEVIGVIPRLLIAREVHERRIRDLRVVETMHERKALMASLSDGFLALPGGFGTLDEAFETLTWSQLGIHRKGLVFVDVLGYWQGLDRLLDRMLAEGFLKPDTRRLAMLADGPEAALDLLAAFVPPADAPVWATAADI
ncbi:MAG: TIGR00730 family Rossman fold protein [Acetobacteraceae bacterium]|nr:TIGR00730 family Rossman fold protein [Acetobacteraceae bacterium]MCX7685930.1 TIGR00730 family Rossman fold protein [Acetobacteraceae bacterium]MDW8398415.1 TIGR00730 family Rossman fold protein [Acetobacteraceae bacterium]